jgi:hypothetical protein
MRMLKLIFVVYLSVFTTAMVCAQSGRSQYTRKSHNYKAPRVRGQKAKIICPVFETSRFPYHGLGLKLGDPFGITYKYYASKRISIALDVGKASSGLYNRYFREKFPSYAHDADTLAENSSLTYSSHNVRLDLIAGAKILYHLEASKISPGLQFYVGGGWQWKNTKLRYNYFYNKTSPNGGDLVNEFRTFDRQRVTMGPQVVLGIEYAYFQLPVSAFMEIEFFTDVQADPGWQRFEGGVGLRYIF